MNQLSPREKILVIVVIYLSLLFAVYRYGYQPVQLEASRLQDEERQLQTEYARLLITPVSREDYIRESQELKAKWQQAAQILPLEPKLVALVEFISQTADHNQVKLIDLKYPANNTEVELEPVVILNLDFSVSGNYHQLLTFVWELENAPRLISINKTCLVMQTKKEKTESFDQENIENINRDSLLDALPAEETTTLEAEVNLSPTLAEELMFDKYDPENYIMQLHISSYFNPLDLPDGVE